ncbi:MAG: TIGR00725 family protein [Verrucomicrobia bacterium]|nr:TIGR00725 family protein [Verrucomicrobiota bacterium]
MKTISVIGAGECDAETAAQAERVGLLLAQQGFTLVCGGLGGVMAAACRGAKTAAGLTIGILPGPDAAAANPWVDIAIPTGLGDARNFLVVRSAHAVIAVGGEFGTLSEIAFALKAGLPVVGLNTWQLAKHGHIEAIIREAASPAEAVRVALELAFG